MAKSQTTRKLPTGISGPFSGSVKKIIGWVAIASLVLAVGVPVVWTVFALLSPHEYAHEPTVATTVATTTVTAASRVVTHDETCDGQVKWIGKNGVNAKPLPALDCLVHFDVDAGTVRFTDLNGQPPLEVSAREQIPDMPDFKPTSIEAASAGARAHWIECPIGTVIQNWQCIKML